MAGEQVHQCNKHGLDLDLAKNTPWKCTTCKKAFSSQLNLDQHNFSVKHRMNVTTKDQKEIGLTELSELVSLVPSTASSHRNGHFHSFPKPCISVSAFLGIFSLAKLAKHV